MAWARTAACAAAAALMVGVVDGCGCFGDGSMIMFFYEYATIG